MPERSPAAVLDPLYKLATCNIKKQKENYFSDIWNKHPHLSDSFEDAKTLLVKAVTRVSNTLSTFGSVNRYVQDLLGNQSGSVDQWSMALSRSWSKTLKPSQQHYSTYIRELLAIKYAIRHWVAGKIPTFRCMTMSR